MASIMDWQDVSVSDWDIAETREIWDNKSEDDRTEWLISVGYFDDNPCCEKDFDSLRLQMQRELAQWHVYCQRKH